MGDVGEAWLLPEADDGIPLASVVFTVNISCVGVTGRRGRLDWVGPSGVASPEGEESIVSIGLLFYEICLSTAITSKAGSRMCCHF